MLRKQFLTYGLKSFTLIRSISSLRSGFVKVNETNLYYEQTGDIYNKDVILCIPGALGSCQSDFSYQLDGLAKDFQVISFDPRGYGKSDKPRIFTKDFFHKDASDAAELMEQLGHKKYSVLGRSDGGIAGIILAGQKRQAVSNLILWGSNCFVTWKDIELIEKTRDLDNWNERIRKSLEENYGKDELKVLWNNWMDGFFSFLLDNLPSGDICIASLSTIECPTLIVHGARDALVPKTHPEYIHANIKHSQYLVIPDGKHNLNMKYNKEFNHLVSRFVKEKIVDFPGVT